MMNTIPHWTSANALMSLQNQPPTPTAPSATPKPSNGTPSNGGAQGVGTAGVMGLDGSGGGVNVGASGAGAFDFQAYPHNWPLMAQYQGHGGGG